MDEIDEKSVMDALVQMKRIGNLLNEVEDLTHQLAESIDRGDQVSTAMLIGMRDEPLQKLQAADHAVREQLEALGDSPAARELSSMLNGGAPARANGRTQVMLCEQVASNKRRLARIVEIDRVLNKRLGREKSAYR